MNLNVVYAVISLTGIWIIMSEIINVPTIIKGVVIGIGCVYIAYKFLPSYKINKIRLFRLSLYPIFLIGQIYYSAFRVIKLIFSGANVDIVDIKTKLSNSFLQTILANSITIVPGSISLDLKENTLTVLRLMEKTNVSSDPEIAGEMLKGKLERVLLKIQK